MKTRLSILVLISLTVFSSSTFALTQKELNALLCEAVKNGDVENAREALRNGADPDELDDVHPNLLPLEIIARQRTPRLVDDTLVQLLFEYGANIGPGDADLATSLSAMQYAIVRNMPNVLERIIPNTDNPTFELRLEFGNALRMAVARGQQDMVAILLRRGVFIAGLFPSLFALVREQEARPMSPNSRSSYASIEVLLQAHVLVHPPVPFRATPALAMSTQTAIHRAL